MATTKRKAAKKPAKKAKSKKPPKGQQAAATPDSELQYIGIPIDESSPTGIGEDAASAQGATEIPEDEGLLSVDPETGKRRMGRPTLYKPEFVKQAEKLAKLGATEQEMADFFEVTRVTFWRWKLEYEDFCSATRAGKDHADARVEASLYHRAVGYTHDAVKIFQHQGTAVVVPYREHVPPDPQAAFNWLKNRRPDVWRDRHEVKHDVTEDMAALFETRRKRAATITATKLADALAKVSGGSATYQVLK